VPTERSTLEDIVFEDGTIPEILKRVESLGLPDWYLTAGCLFQRVWNHLHGYPPANGILDYDLFYCDPSDLSWEAEDGVIKRTQESFADIGVNVQVRNQARVHIWFEDHFGIPIAPFASSKVAIRNFLATACCLGIRSEDGAIEVFTPFGTDDLFDLIIRRNPEAAGPQSAYEQKTERWTQRWPRLTVMPWQRALGRSSELR
jgi:hypothetical protein